MDKTIDSFSGGYRFLSNFYPVKVKYEGVEYSSTEHAFQAAKTVNPSDRKKIRESGRPSDAKRLGRKVQLRTGWEAMKYDVMLDLLRQKFAKSPLREQLLETGDATLIEGNDWGDQTWGVCNGKGKNMLGKLLMQVRSELRLATASPT